MWMTECSMFPIRAHALTLSAVLEILIPESLAALVQLMRNPSQQLVSLVVFTVNALCDPLDWCSSLRLELAWQPR
jgi:hypothetical protein